MKELKLIPITRKNKKGELYKRSSKIENQIKEALSLDRKRLLERANQKDYNSDEYIQPECLVYLIRAFRLSGDFEMADELMFALIDRCKKKIDTILRMLLTQHYINECYGEVIDEIIGEIYDMNSDKSNFAETRFWVWLNGRICNVRRKYFKYQEEDSQTDNYEEYFRYFKTNIGTELERKDCLLKALSALTERERQIYVMRYDWNWQVFSKDSSVNTISKHFNVTARMVQKWFKKAEEKLRNSTKG